MALPAVAACLAADEDALALAVGLEQSPVPFAALGAVDLDLHRDESDSRRSPGVQDSERGLIAVWWVLLGGYSIIAMIVFLAWIVIASALLMARPSAASEQPLTPVPQADRSGPPSAAG
jgi:hypothetical protein